MNESKDLKRKGLCALAINEYPLIRGKFKCFWANSIGPYRT